MYLKKAIFHNRAPFEHIELNFIDAGVNVLSAINGKGKTTILSHITDAFHELARQNFKNSYKGIENKFYRYSSSIYSINMVSYSVVYFRFRHKEKLIDYLDLFGDISEDEYNNIVRLDSKIAYVEIKNHRKSSAGKIFSKNISYDKINDLFNDNILSYFPTYRYEQPGYLNDPYKIKLKFKTEDSIVGELPNSIESISRLDDISNWLLDVILDKNLYPDHTGTQRIYGIINNIISTILISKLGEQARIGIGPRREGFTRIAVTKQDGQIIYPSIFNMSSGESGLMALFCEIVRQVDNIKKLNDVFGIVLIDEIDKNLHIKLQKEALPELFKFFPKIQFIVSTHSPFLNMGLGESMPYSTRVIDLDNNGIVTTPIQNEQYLEVYNMMIDENARYAERYNALKQKIDNGSKTLIITEGKTDYKHLKKSQQQLDIHDLDIEYYEVDDSWGSSKLKNLIESISLINQQRKIICIFDRDEDEYIKYVNADSENYRYFGNNVYAFAIPLVRTNEYGDKISIEHYYRKKDLLKEDASHRRLFLGKEFYESGNSKDGKFQTRISQIKTKVNNNGIIDEKVFSREDLQFEHSLALTKENFANLILTDESYPLDFDFSEFKKIFDVIRAIIRDGA